MRRRLTFYTAGGTSLACDLDADDAETLLGRWQAVVEGQESAERVVQLDCVPVMHLDLGAVVAVGDDVASEPAP